MFCWYFESSFKPVLYKDLVIYIIYLRNKQIKTRDLIRIPSPNTEVRTHVWSTEYTASPGIISCRSFFLMTSFANIHNSCFFTLISTVLLYSFMMVPTRSGYEGGGGGLRVKSWGSTCISWKCSVPCQCALLSKKA